MKSKQKIREEIVKFLARECTDENVLMDHGVCRRLECIDVDGASYEICDELVAEGLLTKGGGDNYTVHNWKELIAKGLEDFPSKPLPTNERKERKMTTHDMNEFDNNVDLDVFDSMRALLDDGVDLDDREAVERVLINPYRDRPILSGRFVNWCIKAAKANLAVGGLKKMPNGGEGLVPNE